MSANFMKKDSPNTFLFFGCWNNINCDNKYLYRDIILYTIKEFELYNQHAKVNQETSITANFPYKLGTFHNFQPKGPGLQCVP